MKTLALVFSPLLFGCLAATAHATTPVAEEASYELVSYADLDLANKADAAILLQRVKAAAQRVCRRDADLLPMDLYHPIQRCAAVATARAMAQVGEQP